MGEREDEPPVRPQDSGDLPDRAGRVPDVLEGHVRHDPVEAGRLKTGQARRIPFEELGPGWVLALSPARVGKGRPGPLDPYGSGGTLLGPATRQVAVPAGEVEEPKAADGTDDP
jgi:hypothetical protein